MNCTFCNSPTNVTDFVSGDKYGWHDCRSCDVSFLTHIGSGRVVSHMYHREMKGKYYVIHADHTVQKLVVGSPTLQESHVLVRCDYPIASINPTNVIQKLQTILLFL